MSIEASRLRALTGLERDDFQNLLSRLDSLRNTDSRNREQALYVFLTKMRTGDSDEFIAADLGLPHKAMVAAIVKAVVGAFESVVDAGFGPGSLSRQAILENTSPVAK